MGETRGNFRDVGSCRSKRLHDSVCHKVWHIFKNLSLLVSFHTEVKSMLMVNKTC